MLNKLFSEDCYMLDIESNGLSPIKNDMTSFALVKFNLNEPTVVETLRQVMHFRINTSINIDMHRVVDEDTAKFRAEHHIGSAESSLLSIDSLQEIAEKIITFVNNTTHNTGCNIFALHTEFDIAFLRGYFEEACYAFPFNHRNIWEISSLIKGMNQDFKSIRDEIEAMDLMGDVVANIKSANFHPHNAFYDCVRQIAFLQIAARKAGIIK